MPTGPDISIVIRTLNESRWLPKLLEAVVAQDTSVSAHETIIVDSGSTDETLAIATRYNCRVVKIRKDEFTFGRSLNIGCSAAMGSKLVFISGHCIPADPHWLRNLTAPLDQDIAYSYGRQIGYETTKFSERQVFAKYFPTSVIEAPGGFFCNNANAALRSDIWAKHPFDEELTGLEDMELAKRLLAEKLQVRYVPEAPVFHIHDEPWQKIKLRYEREAIALQKIMPEIQLTFGDFLRYLAGGILHDCSEALNERRLLKLLPEIAMFRLMQYWGSYQGNRDHTKLSRNRKERYFYPKKSSK